MVALGTFSNYSAAANAATPLTKWGSGGEVHADRHRLTPRDGTEGNAPEKEFELRTQRVPAPWGRSRQLPVEQ